MAELANGKRKVKVITVTGGKGGVGKCFSESCCSIMPNGQKSYAV